ncbi:MAG TPA: TIR domain-containing protein [Pyrinomonadaceae bacterium]|nr:TIR domain-containing protein [Pyrinomonadaceae bacterium]
MPFNDDIFISYAHIDDRPLDEVKGWVTSFHERLNDRLAMLLGTELRIWWDQREQSNQYLIGMIGERISNTLLLVSIVTPRYVNSDWCRAEVREFCRRADETGGIVVGNQPRVFKVNKTPVRPEHQPEELGGLLSYDFYEIDANGNAREFRQEIGANKDLKYWAVFEDLAQGIKRVLESARPQPARAVTDESLPLARKVYLAQTTVDLKDERDRIKRELLQQGFYVLPDKDLPTETATEFAQAVSAEIKRCVLSVHLIGGSYGSIPDGEEERSVIHWQSDIAAEQTSNDASFSRLIWMPHGLEFKGARQRQFIEDLRTKLRPGSELLETSIEELKTRILEKLNPQPKQAAAAENPSSDLTRVYLIHDNRDADEVKPIDDYLYEQGFEVIRSLQEGDEPLVSQYHRDNLLQCDATLIYYGQGSELWLRSKLWDLQKAPGWGRARPMKAKAVYVSAPATSSKQSFRTREVPLVLQNFGQFSAATLQPFVQALQNGG